MTDDDCICKGTWRMVVKETEHLIGQQFHDSKGEVFTFFGLVHAEDDYYYGMHGKAGLRLLSCVGNLDTFGFELEDSDALDT